MEDLKQDVEILLDLGVCEETISFAISINGYKKETFENILYWKTGYRSFEQLKEEEEER